MKHLVGKNITKSVEFMGDNVDVRKLSAAEVMKIQKLVKAAGKSKDEDGGLNLLKEILRIAVVGAAEISDQDFSTFPLSELNDLSEKVLSFSGIGNNPEGN